MQTILGHEAGPLIAVYDNGIAIVSKGGVGVVDVNNPVGLLMVVLDATRRTTQEQLEQMPTTVIPLARVYEVIFQP